MGGPEPPERSRAMTAVEREKVQAMEMKLTEWKPITIDPINLADETWDFCKEEWNYIGQVKVERTAIGERLSHQGSPEYLVGIVADSDLGEWAVSGGPNKAFITSDHARIFRVVSTSMLEGTVLAFDAK